MKKVKLLVLVLVFLSLNVKAQTNNEAAVAAAVERFNKAMIDADRPVLEELTSSDLSYGHSAGKVQNKAEFVVDAVSGPFDFKTIEAAGQNIRLSGNIAIVRHTMSFAATNNGAPVDVKLGNLQIWRKDHGKWKLLARQAFKLP